MGSMWAFNYCFHTVDQWALQFHALTASLAADINQCRFRLVWDVIRVTCRYVAFGMSWL